MKTVLILLFLSIHAGLLQAQQRVRDEASVVTPTRTQIPPEQVTTSITVITAKDIEQLQADTVLEVLRNVPGLDVVQSGSRGSSTSVFVRGANSNQVLVLVDGMEVNSVTAGLFNFAHLPTDNVEKIEILRGAGGALYGSKAVGGVIHIITKQGKGKPQGTLSAEGGNGRTHRETFNLSGETAAWGYSVSGGLLKTDGFRATNDDYQNSSAAAALTYRVTDQASLSGTFWLTETRLGLFNSNNFIPAPDPNDRQEDQFVTSRLQWQHHPAPYWDYRLGLGYTQGHERNVVRADAVDAADSVSRIRPRIINPQFQTNTVWHPRNELTFGIDWDIRDAQFRGIHPKQNNQALYLQNQIRLLENALVMVGGVRWDHNEDFGQAWSPSTSAAYLIREWSTKLKWSYSESFRAPTFNDLFFPCSPTPCSNPDLRPEESWEINLGLEQTLLKDRLQLETIYFHREVEDLIVFRGARPENFGQTIFDGFEFITRLKLPHGFSWGGNYTVMNASDRITRRPKHKGNMTLNYDNGPFHLNLTSHIIGHRLDVDAITFATIDKGGYARFDLASSYLLPWQPDGVKALKLYGKIANLFDRKYEEADGFRGAPLNFLIGIQGTFGEK